MKQISDELMVDKIVPIHKKGIKQITLIKDLFLDGNHSKSS